MPSSTNIKRTEDKTTSTRNEKKKDFANFELTKKCTQILS